MAISQVQASALFEPPGLSTNQKLVNAAGKAMTQAAGTRLHGAVV